MMNISSKIATIVLAVLLLVLPALSGCSDDDEENKPLSTPTTTAIVAPAEDVVITIGNLTDVTGPASSAMSIIDMALDDMVEYWNDNRIIPGIKLQVIGYDTQMDPAKYIPGYQWLKEKKADFIVTGVPGIGETLLSHVNNDKILLFTWAPSKEALSPPGHVFAPAFPLWNDLSYTTLKWVAENAPGFPNDRPARIGGAMWNDPGSVAYLAGAEAYAEAYPEQYEWVGGYTTNFSFTWGPEVDALKDCDYVLPPVMMASFINEYQDAGYTTKFIGFPSHTAFFGMIDAANEWENIDGMLFSMTARYWNEEGELINLFKKLVNENHSDAVETIMRSGTSYLAAYPIYMIFALVATVVEDKGPENFNSTNLYEAAQSFSITMDGAEHSFSETKRSSVNYIGIYELDSTEEDIFRFDPGWYPLSYSP